MTDCNRQNLGSIQRGTPLFENSTSAGGNLPHRRLYARMEVEEILHLDSEQFAELVSTRQLTPFRIAGVERFDSRDLDKLIDAYKATAMRRLQ